MHSLEWEGQTSSLILFSALDRKWISFVAPLLQEQGVHSLTTLECSVVQLVSFATFATLRDETRVAL